MRSSLVVSDGNPEPLDLCCTLAHNAEAKTSTVVHMGIHVAAAQSLDLLTRTFLEKSGKSIRVRLPPNGVCMKEHLCLPPNGACMKEHSALQMRTRIHAHTCTFRMTFGKPRTTVATTDEAQVRDIFAGSASITRSRAS